MRDKIVLKELAKQFSLGGQSSMQALKGVNLEAGQGELTAIIGRSGSGKTTLLNIMAGLLKPTSGSVIVDGVEISRLNERDLVKYRREKVGLVFQDFNLIPTLNAFENVMLPYQYVHGNRGARRRAEEVLASAQMPHRAHNRVNVLSGGEQQRVAIARALVNDPEIIMADEPTGNLDYETGNSIVSVLAGLAHADQKTVLIVTHDEAIIKVADRWARLADGTIIDSGVGGATTCKACHYELPHAANFCVNCGSKQNESSAVG